MHECVWCVRAIGLWIISQWHRMNAAFVCSISINSNQCVHFNCRRDAFFCFILNARSGLHGIAMTGITQHQK